MATEAEPGARPEVVPSVDFGKLRSVRPRDVLLRFVFGAGISVGAGVSGKAVGARFGGAFLSFPAILPASLTLIQEKENTRRADRNAIGAVLGGVALIVFGGVGEATFAHVAAPVALIGALLAWAVVAFALYAALAFLKPETCDAGRD